MVNAVAGLPQCRKTVKPDMKIRIGPKIATIAAVGVQLQEPNRPILGRLFPDRNMQTLIASLLASEPFRRALCKPPYISALLVMMAMTIVVDFAELWISLPSGDPGRLEAVKTALERMN